MVGRAAEIAQARDIEIEVGVPDDRALVERLRCLVELEAAAFDDEHGERAASELARDGDPGSAGADDAEIGIERSAVGDLAKVEKHRAARSSGERDHGTEARLGSRQHPAVDDDSIRAAKIFLYASPQQRGRDLRSVPDRLQCAAEHRTHRQKSRSVRVVRQHRKITASDPLGARPVTEQRVEIHRHGPARPQWQSHGEASEQCTNCAVEEAASGYSAGDRDSHISRATLEGWRVIGGQEAFCPLALGPASTA